MDTHKVKHIVILRYLRSLANRLYIESLPKGPGLARLVSRRKKRGAMGNRFLGQGVLPM